MRKLLYTTCIILVALALNAQTKISPQFFGGNLWYTDYSIGRGNYDKITTDQWNRLKNSGMTMMRQGGTGYNVGEKEPETPLYYVDIVDDIRSNNMEPMITVPLKGLNGDEANDMDKIRQYAGNAAEIVRMVNVVNKRHVSYFIISNEPGGNNGIYDPEHVNTTITDATEAKIISRYVKEFSVAMKKVDPDIKIIAPELEFNIYLLFTDLLADPANPLSITGTIPAYFNDASTGAAAGKQYVDYISFHTYSGYYPELDLREKFMSEGDDQQIAYQSFYSDYPSAGGIHLMIDEFNVGTLGTTSSIAQTEVENTSSADPNSFISAQVLAEKMCGMMATENPSSHQPLVTTCNIWSTQEGDAYGFLHDNSTYSALPKPSYWHYWLLGNYFKGSYYPNTNATSYHDLVTNFPSTYHAAAAYGTKAFSCKASDYIAVLVLNEDSVSHSITINFGNTPQSSGTSNNLAFDMGLGNATGSYPTSIPASSSYLIFFDCSGAYTGYIYYLQSDQVTWNSTPSSYNTMITLPSSGTIPAPLTISLVDNADCSSNGNKADATSSLSSGTNTWYSLPEKVSLGTGTGINDLPVGNYMLENTTSCGTSSTSFSIYQKAPLVNAGADRKFCSSGTVEIGDPDLPDPGTYTLTYSWVPSVTCTDCRDETISPSSAATYTMTVTDANSCSATDETDLSIPASTGAFIRDSEEDIGDQPNNQTAAALSSMFWLSSDIWNRVTDDEQPWHQNPQTGSTNTIYVKVTNNSCDDITDATLKVYFSKASTGLQWDLNWINFTGASFGCSPSVMYGDEITYSPAITTFPKNSETVVKVNWSPPDPTDYACGPGTGELGHFCILAHFDANTTAPYDPLGTLSTSVWQNAFENNNVAWKNMEVVAPPGLKPMVKPVGNTLITNINGDSSTYVRLRFFSRKDNNDQTIYDYATMRLWFTKQLIQSWKDGGKRGEGIVLVNDSVVQLTAPDTYMDNIFMNYQETQAVGVQINALKNPYGLAEDAFKFDVIQYAANDTVPEGGERFLIQKSGWELPLCAGGNDTISSKSGGMYTNDSLYISGDVTVGPADTLSFDHMTVFIAANSRITVSAGGVLLIDHSELLPACSGDIWNGIEVKGDTVKTQLLLTNSFIMGADTALILRKTINSEITGTSFIGTGSGIAIVMNKAKDFIIEENMFANYPTAIGTFNGYPSTVASSIRKNVVMNVNTAIASSASTHTKLDIQCNRFFYSQYGIYSTGSTIKDQGDSIYGAGNEFISNSTNADHMWKQITGNNPVYYYDSFLSPDMSVTTTASGDRNCYTYSFDTTGSRRNVYIPYLDNNSAYDNKLTGGLSVSAVPNPNSGEASIYFSLGEQKQGELVVRNIYGTVIDRYRLNTDVNKIDVSYSDLPGGIYFLTLTSVNGERKTSKMVIAH
jgi:hypothetical protein